MILNLINFQVLEEQNHLIYYDVTIYFKKKIKNKKKKNLKINIHF